MIRIKIAASIIACITAFLSPPSFGEVVVVVNPNSSISELDDKWLSAIFLGKKKKYPDGSLAVPVEQETGTPARDKFNEKVIKKSEVQLKAFWSQRIFTGKGQPPKQVSGSADVKKLVSENPAIIGYIDASEVDNTVKIIRKLE
ncbi:MAG: phosphate ABC transporter substrate-binding protein [Pseudomonadales bacterium]|uniref:ABC-type phosphate transport system, periplasmic component n=1 Tax=Oleiphilus messinensis TaxID=141451 RepID=A0A1Y0I767_9GAMM|nr:phosphate ABC transporter substrate-binding protein [Oleiphilus messinensis]ARU55355.1 ABC-type phosphate transport system, periplasmic component [Oleiphilus messinensis]MCG8610416.1 phosphate ABC transporter substrate-binding protein [Pseudomonadales bacterium]